MFSWLNPWAVLRARKEAQRIEADRIATAEAIERRERMARVIAASIERTKKPVLRAVAPLSAQQAILNERQERSEWQQAQDRKALDRLKTRQRVEDEERRARNASSDAENSFITAAYLGSLRGATDEPDPSPARFAGGGGNFDGAGASGNWSDDSASRSSTSSDSGSSSSSSSSDSSSSSSSDSGGSSSGGSD